MNTADENQVIEHLINVIHTSLLELAETDSLYGKNDFRTGQIYACGMPGSFTTLPDIPHSLPKLRY